MPILNYWRSLLLHLPSQKWQNHTLSDICQSTNQLTRTARTIIGLVSRTRLTVWFYDCVVFFSNFSSPVHNFPAHMALFCHLFQDSIWKEWYGNSFPSWIVKPISARLWGDMGLFGCFLQTVKGAPDGAADVPEKPVCYHTMKKIRENTNCTDLPWCILFLLFFIFLVSAHERYVIFILTHWTSAFDRSIDWLIDWGICFWFCASILLFRRIDHFFGFLDCDVMFFDDLSHFQFS